MLFHCLHVKSNESLCYGFKCTFVQKKVVCDSRVETPEPALLYSVCCFINSEQPVGIWPDFILCVCVTHFAKEGRRSVGKKKRPHSERPEAACCKNRDISTSPVNGSARTAYESGWKSVPRIFACVIIDQPRLKGVLHAGRRCEPVSTSFWWDSHLMSPFPVVKVFESCALLVLCWGGK